MINENEQRVISVASGTFEYEGKTYRAKASYVSQLRGKMDQDGVELTSAQADSAIQQMMANIANGVRQGYLEEVGTGGTEETARDRQSGNKRSPDKTGQKGKSGQTEENEGGQPRGSEDSQLGGSEDSQPGENEGSQTGENEPESVFDLTEGISEAARAGTSHTENVQIAALTEARFLSCGITAALILLLFLSGAAVYVKKKKRRKKMAGGMIGCALLGISILLLGWGYLFEREAVSTKRFEQVVMQTGYLREACQNAVFELKQSAVRAGISTDAVGEWLDEVTVYRDAKVLLTGEEKEAREVLREREGGMREEIARELPGVSAAQTEELAQALAHNYRSGLWIPWRAYLDENCADGQKRAGAYSVAGLIWLAVAVAILITKTRYAHRAVRGMCIGFLGAGVGFAGSGIVWMAEKSPLPIEPDKYRELIGAYVQSICQSGVYFGILLICIGLALGIVSHFMKTRIE